MSHQEIVDGIRREIELFDIDPFNKNSLPMIVLTGGEPTIQNNLLFLCEVLKHYTPQLIAVETNGTRPHILKELKNAKVIDWITVSPKPEPMKDPSYLKGILEEIPLDELKVVLDNVVDPLLFQDLVDTKIKPGHAFIQPCSQNYAPAIDFVKRHPQWRLSVQIQKEINVR